VSHSPPEDKQAELRRSALAHMRTLEAVRAPDRLRRSVEQMASEAAARPRRRLALPWLQPRAPRVPRAAGANPLRVRLTVAAALSAAALAVVAILPGTGARPAPTVLQASRVALEPATLASPAESVRNRDQLEISVEGLPYPYWGGHRGWPAAGARRDRLGGRSVTTVFYATGGGARIGYAIVAGRPLPEPPAGTVLDRGGVRFRVLSAGGATIVTWREAGHTCILAGRGVPARAMMRLVLS
jgi:hypothetical protein